MSMYTISNVLVNMERMEWNGALSHMRGEHYESVMNSLFSSFYRLSFRRDLLYISTVSSLKQPKHSFNEVNNVHES